MSNDVRSALHVLDWKAALLGELLRLHPGQPLIVFFERDVRVICVRDPDWPVDLVIDHLRLCFPEDDPVATDLNRLLRLDVAVRTRPFAATAEPWHEQTLVRPERVSSASG